MYQYDGNYEEFIALKADREAREAATEEKRRQFLKREIEWVRRVPWRELQNKRLV